MSKHPTMYTEAVDLMACPGFEVEVIAPSNDGTLTATVWVRTDSGVTGCSSITAEKLRKLGSALTFAADVLEIQILSDKAEAELRQSKLNSDPK